MATLIFVDKENGEPGTRVAPKDGMKLGSGPCKYTGCSQIHRYCEATVHVAWSWGRHLVSFVGKWSQVTEYCYCNVLVMGPFFRFNALMRLFKRVIN